MFRTKKFLSLVTSICLLLETALPPTVFAAGALTPNVSYVSPSNSPSPPRTNPGSDLVFKFVAVNTTGIAGSSPYVAFSGSQSGYSFVNSGTGFMIS